MIMLQYEDEDILDWRESQRSDESKFICSVIATVSSFILFAVLVGIAAVVYGVTRTS